MDTNKKFQYPPKVSFSDKVFGLLNNKDAIKVMHRQFEKLGDQYTIQSRLSPFSFVFTRSPDLIDQFMRQNHRKYDKSVYQTEMLRKYVGKGLLTNYGLDWKRQRKLIQPGFSHQRIEALHTRMLEEVVSSIESIPENQEIDFYTEFNRLTFRVVAKSLFSSNISESQISRMSEVISKSQQLFILETRNPLFTYALNWSGVISRHLKNDVQEIRDIFQSLIQQRRTSGKSEDDLLDLMLEVTYEDTGEPMTETQLIDELLILFIAGHETTANALSFTFWLLAENPEYQSKLHDEMSQLGSKTTDLVHLFAPSLTQHILKESMRLYPPAWVVDRQALQEDTFEEYSWAKDTIIIGNLYEMNRREDMWEKPLSFIPERFEDAKKIKEKKYIPFGSGPRYCIGEHFASMEMQLVLRYYFGKFRFEKTQDKLKLLTYVTLRPQKIMGKKIKL